MKLLQNIFALYWDGFRSMTLGKTLWKIIIIKLLIILFGVKYLFYPTPIKKIYPKTEERAEHFRRELLRSEK